MKTHVIHCVAVAAAAQGDQHLCKLVHVFFLNYYYYSLPSGKNLINQ